MINKLQHEILTNFIIENREYSYRLAYSYVKNQQDALDIVQEAICKALAAEKSLQDFSAVKPWFYRILTNTAIDFIRKNKRYVYVEDDMLEALGGSVCDHYLDVDLQEAIERLPTRDKTIILLRYFEGMKIDEIAFVMNENINTVKTRLYASLRKLRLNLEQAG